MTRWLRNFRPTRSPLTLFICSTLGSGSVLNEEELNTEITAPGTSLGLPVYRKEHVECHKNKESGIWVTYGEGVYDITKFITSHPGGIDKIMLSAGGSIEPYWRIYRQHLASKLAFEILAPLRVGTLHPDDVLDSKKNIDSSDPFSSDPAMSPVLKTLLDKPAMAETPATLLTQSWLTPNDLWFVRNHHPVPFIKEDDYRLTVSAPEIGLAPVTLTLADLRNKFKKHKVVCSLQCGGNRRAELSEVEPTLGISWGIGAIATAEWGGVLLVDVLDWALSETGGLNKSIKNVSEIEEAGLGHVQFAAAEGLVASIPFHKLNGKDGGDVLLAYEMNGEALPRMHGFPVRAVVPGVVGVRNVKWLTEVKVASEEAGGAWQRGIAYKGFGPSVKSVDGIDASKIHSLQEMPVTSAITYPQKSAVLPAGSHTLKGFAYSGGGRGIVRVDVSVDGGKTWQTATLTDGSQQKMHKAWAWTFWECDVELPASESRVEIMCRATDASYNVQPESPSGIWNIRGINCNSWHRVGITVKEDDEDEE